MPGAGPIAPRLAGATKKRLAAKGLLRESGREREGNRPNRRAYEITGEGRLALAELRRAGLREVWFG